MIRSLTRTESAVRKTIIPIEPLLSAVLGCLCLCGASAPLRAQKPARIPDGPALLKRVLDHEDRVPFEARQTVVLSEGGTARATITREIHLGVGRNRIEYILPRSAAGRLIVNDGQHRWEYSPARRTALRTAILRKPSTPGRTVATLARVQRSYRLRVDTRPAQHAGRPAWVLRITPRVNDRPRRVWWVDCATYLVLKREVYDPDGTLDRVSSFSSLNFHPASSPAKVRFTLPPGARVIRRSEPQAIATVRLARKRAPSWAHIPDTLGEGFDFESARPVTVKGAPGILLSYSDGLITLSLFEVAGRTAMPAASGGGRAVRIGPHSGLLYQLTSFRILTWTPPGSTYNLVADLAEQTLLRIARGAFAR